MKNLFWKSKITPATGQFKRSRTIQKWKAARLYRKKPCRRGKVLDKWNLFNQIEEETVKYVR